MAITESSITLNFPDNNFFRLGDCEGYKSIQNNFSEMDVCWYEQISDTLYIIELKNWENNTLNEESDPNISAEEIAQKKEGISNYRVRNLFKKSVDSICMFMSILLKKPYSSNIQDCLPFEITKYTKIKLLSIVNWDSTDDIYISNINTAYRSKFGSYAKLFDIRTFVVITKEKASQTFDWVT